MLKNKIISMFSLTKKAGKLVCGFDAVCEELKKKQWNTVFITSDLSEKSKKEIEREAGKNFFMLVNTPVTMQDLSVITHKNVGVFCVTNQNLALKLKALSEEYVKEEK